MSGPTLDTTAGARLMGPEWAVLQRKAREAEEAEAYEDGGGEGDRFTRSGNGFLWHPAYCSVLTNAYIMQWQII
jgi:hypothetical protein